MVYVAVYCRVSTDKDDQINSFENQKSFFENQIARNPKWSLYEIYADEGLSGTSVKKRKAFQRMIADARRGKFNMIITKEVSRFARNTVDVLQYTRDLAKMGIGVQFVLDNINTLERDGELRLSIMASIAQEESRKISERVKWGQARQMEKGVVFGRSCLGYDVRNGKLYIEDSGAKIVKLIFHKFVNEQKGTCEIARELTEEGYKTVTGLTEWSNTTILKILRNEKYCGDLIQKKTITTDYLTHEKKYNHGEEDMISIKNHHNAIIKREVWEEAQKRLCKNRPSSKIRARYSNRYAFSGKIKCGNCGHSFSAKYKRQNGVVLYKSWHCSNHSKKGNRHINEAGVETGCDLSCLINENELKKIICKVIASVDIDREKIACEIYRIISDDAEHDSFHKNETKEIEEAVKSVIKRRELLLDLYLNVEISKEEYLNKNNELLRELTSLDKRRERTKEKKTNTKPMDIKKYIKDILSGEVYSENFCKFILEKIVVYSRDEMKVYIHNFRKEWSASLQNIHTL